MPVFLIGDNFIASVLALSALSGVGSYLQGRRDNRLTGGLIDAITEVVLALVVGLAVAYLLESYEVKRGYTCAIVLVASNNGADTLSACKSLVMQGLERFFNYGGKGK